MTAASLPTVLVGPMLRFVGETEGTVWVETSGPFTTTAGSDRRKPRLRTVHQRDLTE